MSKPYRRCRIITAKGCTTDNGFSTASCRSAIVNTYMQPTAPPPTTPPVPPVKEEKQPSGFHDFLSTVGILLLAFAVALLIINFVFRTYQVDGRSMEPTLQNLDKLIIWKVPRTIAKITGNDYIPKRGEVIVFEQSGLGEYGQEDSKQLIKRAIGLPGDRVVVQDGKITVYNNENPDGFIPDETLAYGGDIPATTGQDIDVLLREDEIFAVGDNRPDSLDSRSFGPINADQIIGKMVLRILPLDKAEFY